MSPLISYQYEVTKNLADCASLLVEIFVSKYIFLFLETIVLGLVTAPQVRSQGEQGSAACP